MSVRPPKRHDLGRRSRWHVEYQSVQARVEIRLHLVGHRVGITNYIRPEPFGVDTRGPAFLHPGLGLLLRVGDDQRPQAGLGDLGRIAPEVAAVSFEDRELVADGVDITEQVACVRVLGDQTERELLTAAPHHDLRAARLDGAGEVQRTPDVMCRPSNVATSCVNIVRHIWMASSSRPIRSRVDGQS